MTSLQQEMMTVVADHAQKASESQYDRSVCIKAVSTARDVISEVPADLEDKVYKSRVLEQLFRLMDEYNDPDGEYTNGKGIIGSLVDDLYSRYGPAES